MGRPVYSVVYMFALTLFFSALVSGVKVVNDARIRANEEGKLKAVVLDALGIPVPAGPHRKEAVAEVFDDRVRTSRAGGRSVYIGYDDDGEEVAGYAFPVAGPGFWGPIEGMVGVDAGAARIVGINFYRHSETPGLGARMTETVFRNQFRGLVLEGREEGEPFFRLVAPGSSKQRGHLDAITGATQTSRAIELFLNRELEIFVSSLAEELRGE